MNIIFKPQINRKKFISGFVLLILIIYIGSRMNSQSSLTIFDYILITILVSLSIYLQFKRSDLSDFDKL